VNTHSLKANLFIVGAPKCGTTAWFEYLGSHRDIFFPAKEYCYFAHDLPKFRFVHSEEEYSKLFEASGDARIIGEASAMYLFSEAAAGAMRQYNPDAKILIFLRDQDEFLPSLHNQFLWEFAEEIEDFETVWRLSGRRPAKTIPSTCLEPRTLDYAAMGRFHEQVARYLDAFPAEQVMVIHFRDWTSDPRKAYLRILDFLGLDDDGRPEFPPVHEGARYRSRHLVRFLLYPPKSVRKVIQLVKRITGLKGNAVYQKAISLKLLHTPGYRKELSPELRAEIRRYYAEDNRLLRQRLSRLPISRFDAKNAIRAVRG
jgi:hypothetical protein